MSARPRTKVSWWMAGSGPASAFWSSMVFVGLMLVALTNVNRLHPHGADGARQFVVVLGVALTVLNIGSSVATGLVWRSERRRWPSIHHLPVPKWLEVWSWGAVAVVVLTAVSWLFLQTWHFGSALLLELTALVLARLWRNYDSRQRDHLLRQLASVDASG